jgi:branched-chain amino acid transport system permease protein
VLTWLPEQLRGFSQYRLLVYSIILIIVMLFKPSGLLGRYEISIPALFEKLYRKIAKKPAQTGTGGA